MCGGAGSVVPEAGTSLVVDDGVRELRSTVVPNALRVVVPQLRSADRRIGPGGSHSAGDESPRDSDGEEAHRQGAVSMWPDGSNRVHAFQAARIGCQRGLSLMLSRLGGMWNWP